MATHQPRIWKSPRLSGTQLQIRALLVVFLGHIFQILHQICTSKKNHYVMSHKMVILEQREVKKWNSKVE